MKNNSDISINIDANTSLFDNGVKGLETQIKSFRDLQLAANAKAAQSNFNLSQEKAKQAKKELKVATEAVNEQQRLIKKLSKEKQRARDNLDAAKSRASSRNADDSFIASEDKNVQKLQKRIQALEKQQESYANSYAAAKERENKARNRLNQKIEQQEQASLSLKQAEEREKLALDKATAAADRQAKKLQELQRAKEKLAQGGSIVSTASYDKAKNTQNRRQKEYDRQNDVVATKKQDYSAAKSRLDKAQKAYDTASNAGTSNDNLSKLSDELKAAQQQEKSAAGSLDKASKNLASKHNALQTATNTLSEKEKNLTKANADEIERLAKQAEKAAERVTKAQQQIASARANVETRKTALENAGNNRESAENSYNLAKTNSENANNRLVGKNNELQAAKSSMADVNQQAKVQLGENEIRQAQKELEQAKKAYEAAESKLGILNSKKDVANSKLNVANKNVESFKLKADTAEAKKNLSEISKKVSLLTIGEKILNFKAIGLTDIAKKIGTVVLGIHSAHAALSKIGSVMSTLVAPGYEYAKQVESARIGIAGIYASMTEIDGKRTTLEQGMQIANSVVDRLNDAAAVTAATPTDLVRTFQGLAGPGLGAGMNTEELMKYTVTGVNAAKAFQLGPEQFIQELRDMVQGGIQASSSTIATSLGLSDADITKMKNSADGLFKSLMDKMQGLSEAANKYPETLAGKEAILKQTLTRVSSEFTSSFEVEIKNMLDDITSLFADVDLTSGKFTVNPEILEYIDKIHNLVIETMNEFGSFDDTGQWYASSETLELWETFKDVAKGVSDVILEIFATLKDWKPVITGIVKGVGLFLKDFIDVAKWILNNLRYLGQILGVTGNIEDTVAWIVKTVLDWTVGGKAVLSVFKMVFNVGKKLFNVFKQSAGAIRSMAGWVGKVFDGLKKIEFLGIGKKIESITNWVKGGANAVANNSKVTAGINFVKNNPKAFGVGGGALAFGAGAWTGYNGYNLAADWYNSRSNALAQKSSDPFSKFFKTPQEVADERKKNRGQDRKGNDDLLNQAKGIPKTDDDAAKKAADAAKKAEDKRLEEIQKHLKKLNKQVDDRLKEALEMQKEHLEKVELLHKQNKVTIEDYYRELANDDKVKAEEELKALKEKYENIKNTEYAPDRQDEKNEALADLAKQIEKAEKKLAAAEKQLAEVIRLLPKSNETPINKPVNQSNNINTDNSNNAVNAPSVGDEKTLIDGITAYAKANHWEDPETYAKAIVAAAKSTGVDARQLAALITVESSGNPHAKSDKGAYGLAQFMPATAAQYGVDVTDPVSSIWGAAKYFANLLRMSFINGDYNLAHAGYNWGPGNLEDGGTPPAETRNHVKKIQEQTDKLNYLPDSRLLKNTTAQINSLENSMDSFGHAIVDVDDAVHNHAIPDIKKYHGETMQLENGINGCVEAVTKIGAYYNPWLAKQVKNNVVGVEQLVANARQDGIGVVDFDENKLEKGDIIVFRNDDGYHDNNQDHVVTYMGEGKGDYRWTGNSSSLNGGRGGVQEYGEDYRKIKQVGQYIIKTGINGAASANNAAVTAAVSSTDDALSGNRSVEALEKKKAAEKATLELKKEIAEIYGEGLIPAIDLLTQETKEKIEKAIAEIPEDKRAEYIANLLIKEGQQIRGLIFEYATRKIETLTKVLENSSKNFAQKVATGAVGLSDAMDRYYNHFFGENSPLKQQADALYKLAAEYQRVGDRDNYFKTIEQLDKIHESMNNIFDSYLKAIQDRNQWHLNMLDADQSRTTGQKEIVKEGIESSTHNMNAAYYSKQIMLARKNIEDLRQEIEKAEKEITETTDEKDINNLKSLIAIHQKEIKNLQEIKIPALEQSKALEESLGRNLTLLEKVQKSAKQSLEDGLYSYLTEGVNEAKSLGDALRDLAVTILKSIQQIFAKRIVNNLMNQWFPVEGQTQETGSKYQFLYDTRYGVGGSIREDNKKNNNYEFKGSSWSDDKTGKTFTFGADGKLSVQSTAFLEKVGDAFGDAAVKKNQWAGAVRSQYGKTYDSSFGLGSSPLMKQGAVTDKTTDTVLYSTDWINSQAKSSTEIANQTANTANAVNTQGEETNQQLAQTNQQLSQIEREMSGAAEISDDFQPVEPLAESQKSADTNKQSSVNRDDLKISPVPKAEKPVNTTVKVSSLEDSKSAKILDSQLTTSTQSLAQEKQSNQQLNSINNNLTEIKTQNKNNANTNYSATTSSIGSVGGTGGISSNFSATSKNFITSAFDTQIGQFAGSAFAAYSLIKGDTKERLLSLIYLESQLIYTAVQAIKTYMLEIAAAAMSNSYQTTTSEDNGNETAAESGGNMSTGSVNVPDKLTGKNFITSAFDSVIGQFAGSAFAAYSLVKGDTKERLLSLIYLELQLMYNALTRITMLSAGAGFATGGYISGAGTSTSDSIPAQLSNGEYVVKAASVQKYGRDMLERINNGTFSNLRVRVPHFATGGYVGSTGAKATDNFASSFGATVSPKLSVNNYVDGKRIFDTYGRDVVRNEVRNTMIKNAKFYAETLGRMR